MLRIPLPEYAGFALARLQPISPRTANGKHSTAVRSGFASEPLGHLSPTGNLRWSDGEAGGFKSLPTHSVYPA